MKLSYKKATEKDWELVRDLEKKAASVSPRFFLAYESEKEMKNYLQEDNVFFIIKDNQPIGTVAYKFKGSNIAHVGGLAILPDYSGKGYGTKALQWLLDQIKKVERVELVVHPRNSAAVCIYLKLGFRIEDWKDNYFGDGEPRLELAKSKEC